MKDLDPSTSVAALLGTKLRKLRTRAGLTQRELGKKVYVSHNRIAQIELGTDPPSEQLIQALEIALDAQGDLMDIWLLMRCSPLPQWVERYVQLESEAVRVCTYTGIVPGMLQTELYAREVLRLGRPATTDLWSERVQARLRRQARLDEREAPVLWSILDETVLRRPVGGPAVMCEQLGHILAMAERPKVYVQVMPLCHVHPAMSGSVELLTLGDGSRVAYLEGHDSGVLVEDSNPVAEYALTYDLLRAQALPVEESLDAIREAMRGYSCELVRSG
ncbi:helix-turn-helix domain-containing protein [Streptomyces chumphonensis]